MFVKLEVFQIHPGQQKASKEQGLQYQFLDGDNRS